MDPPSRASLVAKTFWDINTIMEYAFKVIETGEIVRHEMKMSEYDAFKKNNPHLERYHEFVPMKFTDGDAAGDSGFKSKMDGGFQEVLSKIADHHPSSELAKNTDFHRKSIKETKTRQILNKHSQKMGYEGVKF
jgi:hypothetical protein